MTQNEITRNGNLVKQQIDDFIKNFAEEFLARVKMRTPVITGRLRDAWSSNVKKGEITVDNEVPYAVWVENGTHKMAPTGMLRARVTEAEQIAAVAKERAGIKD